MEEEGSRCIYQITHAVWQTSYRQSSRLFGSFEDILKRSLWLRPDSSWAVVFPSNRWQNWLSAIPTRHPRDVGTGWSGGDLNLIMARRQHGVALSQAWSNSWDTGPYSSLLAWPLLSKRAGELERKLGQVTSRQMIHKQSDFVGFSGKQ